jgi:hypothetical protein
MKEAGAAFSAQYEKWCGSRRSKERREQSCESKERKYARSKGRLNAEITRLQRRIVTFRRPGGRWLRGNGWCPYCRSAPSLN